MKEEKPNKRPVLKIEVPFREKNPEEEEKQYSQLLEDWFVKEVEKFFQRGKRKWGSVFRVVLTLKKSSPTPLPFLSLGKQEKWIKTRLNHLYTD